jgi:hypothetical protein
MFCDAGWLAAEHSPGIAELLRDLLEMRWPA